MARIVITIDAGSLYTVEADGPVEVYLRDLDCLRDSETAIKHLENPLAVDVMTPGELSEFLKSESASWREIHQL